MRGLWTKLEPHLEGSAYVNHLAADDSPEKVRASYGADCPVAVVYRASQPDELVLTGTLADIADQVEAADLKQAAVILVGWALARVGAESGLYKADRPRSEAPRWLRGE